MPKPSRQANEARLVDKVAAAQGVGTRREAQWFVADQEEDDRVVRHDRTNRPTSTRRLPVGLPALLSISQAARLLGIGRSTLYNGLRTGASAVPVVRVGKQWRVPRTAIERLLDGSQPATAAPTASEPPREKAPPFFQGCCPSCGSPLPARAARMCSAARRSSSTTGHV